LQLLKADCAPGRWRQRGKSFPLGATLVPGGTNFSVFAKHITAAQLLLFDGADAANASRVIDLDVRTSPTVIGTPLCPTSRRARSMATASPGLSILRGGFVSTLTSCCSTRTGNASPGRRVAAGKLAPGRQRRHRAEERGGRPRRIRLGGRRTAGAAFRKDHHLRDACWRVYPASELDRLLGGIVAVRRLLQREARYVEPCPLGDIANALGRTDQD